MPKTAILIMKQIACELLENTETYLVEPDIKDKSDCDCHHRIQPLKIITIDFPFAICRNIYKEQIIIRVDKFNFYIPSKEFIATIEA